MLSSFYNEKILYNNDRNRRCYICGKATFHISEAKIMQLVNGNESNLCLFQSKTRRPRYLLLALRDSRDDDCHYTEMDRSPRTSFISGFKNAKK